MAPSVMPLFLLSDNGHPASNAASVPQLCNQKLLFDPLLKLCHMRNNTYHPVSLRQSMKRLQGLI